MSSGRGNLPAGDMENLVAGEDGTISQTMLMPQLSLEKIRGRSVMVHDTPENDAARKIGCAILPSG